MKIRTVDIKDVKACHLIEQRCFEKSEAASYDDIAKRADVYPAGFLVAEMNNRIVGMVNSGATDKDDITDEAFKQLVGHTEYGKNSVIFSIAVMSEFQGKQIASSLMKQFIERATQLKKEKILLLCKTGLIPFYEKQGFNYANISASIHGGFQWHEMVYYIKKNTSGERE